MCFFLYFCAADLLVNVHRNFSYFAIVYLRGYFTLLAMFSRSFIPVLNRKLWAQEICGASRGEIIRRSLFKKLSCDLPTLGRFITIFSTH